MNIQVLKYDPAVDAAPYYVSGEVAYREPMTLLEVLADFHENVEAVNFDYSCGCRLCGRCAVMVNGEPKLMCVAKAEDINYTFEPLKGYPVIRDLIVDKDSFDNKLSSYFDRIRVEPFTEETIVPKNYDPSVREPLYRMEFCCRCGVCDAACPVVASKPNDYLGPAGMLAIAYRFFDPLDQGDRVIEAVNEGLYHCIMCGRCDTACPQQDIAHLEAWTALRTAAEARGLKPSYAK